MPMIFWSFHLFCFWAVFDSPSTENIAPFVILRHILKNLPLEWTISDVFSTRRLPIAFTLKRCSFTFLNVNFFSPNCTKFVVECDWNSKNSKNRWVFERKPELFQNCYMWQIFAECVSNGIFSWKCLCTLFLRLFWEKLERIWNWRS